MVPGQDEPYVFSFFTDVVLHPDVNEIGGIVRDKVMIGINDIMTYTNRWKKYRQLWRLQRVSGVVMCECQCRCNAEEGRV